MHTQVRAQRKKTIWTQWRQYLSLLLFSFILTACSQSPNPQQGVISGDQLSAPFPKAMTALELTDTNLIVDVIINGDTENPWRVEGLVVDTEAGTFSGKITGFPEGTAMLSLIYSINDPAQGAIEVTRASEIEVVVEANKENPADFFSTTLTYTDSDGDSISNLDELAAGTDINASNYFVGGSVTGLTGTGLVLQNNEGDDLAIKADGTFIFSVALADKASYAITILTSPTSPDQTCQVTEGSGQVNGTAVSAVKVTCKESINIKNSAPTARNVSITDDNGQSTVIGDRLTGGYTYADVDKDAEGVSTFRWLRNGAAISDATTTGYTLVAADSGQTIVFEVMPIAATGSTTGSTAASAGITVLDTTPPVITLKGSDPVSLAQPDAYTEAGASATDDVDGSVEVTITGGVDVNTVGSYTITYSATDAAGNTTTIDRTVDVVNNRFITTWKTDNPGVSDDNQVMIKTEGGGYNYTVDWGDGQTDSGVKGSITHTYATAGTYTVSISGDFPRIVSGVGSDAEKLLTVDQWGNIKWQSMNSAFDSCKNLVVNASDAPDLSQVAETSLMFSNASAFNQDLNHWDISAVIHMEGMFRDAITFNQELSNWNVSAVTHMRYMFESAKAFNQDLSNWDVSAVTDMEGMFDGASAFNQNLSNWDVSTVTDMNEIFNEITLSPANYDALLKGWSARSLQSNVTFDGGNSQYSSTSQDARDILIQGFGWTVTDGGVINTRPPIDDVPLIPAQLQVE